MTEIQNNDQIEQIEEFSTETINANLNEQNNETIEFLTECNMSIFNLTKDQTNDMILKPKEKIIKKKCKLFQYNLILKNYVRIDNFATFSDQNILKTWIYR